MSVPRDRTDCLSVPHVRTDCLSVPRVRTNCLSVHRVRTDCLQISGLHPQNNVNSLWTTKCFCNFTFIYYNYNRHINTYLMSSSNKSSRLDSLHFKTFYEYFTKKYINVQNITFKNYSYIICIAIAFWSLSYICRQSSFVLFTQA